MVVVLTEGQIPRQVVKCDHCEAILGYYPHDQKLNTFGGQTYIICPCCDEHVEV